MIIWLRYNFSDNINIIKLLLLDDFSAHWTENVVATAKELNITSIKHHQA